MKKLLGILVSLALFVVLMAGSAVAMPITLLDTSLQDFFDSEGWQLDAYYDQLPMLNGWGLTEGSSGANMTLYRELSPPDVAFGIYSVAGMERVEVFDISDTPEARAIVAFDSVQETTVIQWWDDGGFLLQQNTYPFTGQTFGFYFATGNSSYDEIYYSNPDLNDLDGDGIFGEDEDVAILLYNLDPASYIFAGDTDGGMDFSDIVSHAESIKPVPEPATMLLFGCGLIGLAVAGRKKFQ